MIAEVMGTEVTVEPDPARMRPKGSEVERLLACNRRAREVAGGTPDYGGIEGFKRGLAATAEWFRDPANLARYKTGTYNV